MVWLITHEFLHKSNFSYVFYLGINCQVFAISESPLFSLSSKFNIVHFSWTFIEHLLQSRYIQGTLDC